MRKVFKVTKSREMKLDGSFLRYNLPPLEPFPDDVVVRWVGQNEEFGIVEVITEKDKELEKAIKLMPSLEEVEITKEELVDLDKEDVENITYGNDKAKALTVFNNYIKA